MSLTTDRTITVTVTGIPLSDDEFAHAHCEWVVGPHGSESCEVLAKYRVNMQDSYDSEDHAPLDVCVGHVADASQIGA